MNLDREQYIEYSRNRNLVVSGPADHDFSTYSHRLVDVDSWVCRIILGHRKLATHHVQDEK